MDGPDVISAKTEENRQDEVKFETLANVTVSQMEDSLKSDIERVVSNNNNNNKNEPMR